MAIADIRHEIVLALAHIHEAQREARAVMRQGRDREKVVAVGELDFLDRQEGMLKRRLQELDQRIAQHRTVFSWLRQIWFGLMFRFDSWIAHG